MAELVKRVQNGDVFDAYEIEIPETKMEEKYCTNNKMLNAFRHFQLLNQNDLIVTSRVFDAFQNCFKTVTHIKYKKGISTLGEGTYGVVKIGRCSHSGLFVALKTIKCKTIEGLSKGYKEAQLQYNFRHHNLVKCLDCYINFNSFECIIVLEYSDSISLRNSIDKYGCKNEEQIVKICQDILSGIRYMHDYGYVHGDIKCSNILLFGSGTAKLCDFGATNMIGNERHILLGSVCWMAPEVILQKCRIKCSADIWSFGCSVLEMISGELPWYEKKFRNTFSAMMYISSGESIPKIPEKISIELRCFICCCLVIKEEKRPSANKLLRHFFFNR